MQIFGALHWLGLFWVALAVTLTVQTKSYAWEQKRSVRWSIAAILLAIEAGWTAFCTFKLGIDFVDNLPLHLCDLGTAALVWHLMAPSKLSREIFPYFGIPGALLALLFPHVTEPEPYRLLAVLRFFVAHTAILCGALRATLARGHAPTLQSLVRAFGFYAALTVPIDFINLALGKNFCYLLEAPQSARFLHGIHIWVYRIGYYPAVFILFTATRWVLCRLVRARVPAAVTTAALLILAFNAHAGGVNKFNGSACELELTNDNPNFVALVSESKPALEGVPGKFHRIGRFKKAGVELYAWEGPSCDPKFFTVRAGEPVTMMAVHLGISGEKIWLRADQKIEVRQRQNLLTEIKHEAKLKGTTLHAPARAQYPVSLKGIATEDITVYEKPDLARSVGTIKKGATVEVIAYIPSEEGSPKFLIKAQGWTRMVSGIRAIASK